MVHFIYNYTITLLCRRFNIRNAHGDLKKSFRLISSLSKVIIKFLYNGRSHWFKQRA